MTEAELAKLALHCLTQEQLSDLLGVTRDTLREWQRIGCPHFYLGPCHRLLRFDYDQTLHWLQTSFGNKTCRDLLQGKNLASKGTPRADKKGAKPASLANLVQMKEGLGIDLVATKRKTPPSKAS